MSLTTLPTPSPMFLDILHDGKYCIGHAVMEVDGMYYFLARTNGNSLWASHMLEEIAALLRELNAPFEAELKQYFDSLPKEISREQQDDILPF